MTAEEAKARILATIAEVRADGFDFGGHWDQDELMSIGRRVDEPNGGWSYSDQAWISAAEANGETI